MPGLVPASTFLDAVGKAVGGRDRPGHDIAKTSTLSQWHDQLREPPVASLFLLWTEAATDG
ncbi:hypothetical protein ACVWWI_000289 [Bradyrhizobium sp. USDA 3686]|nr:hypothetical protein [Bradyrhizobium canariense]OSI29535.1 hypothetical protein BST65_08080 [Bradyrhizobium canariense]OSI32897.1 hypothetical protein BST66_15110 [Bradyrhizobium canariense]OSI43604.1 hypothetical protein BSZ20_15860 [Bradyrhizobium canariense]OSI52271.1 hypothetical protein BST67_11205 [Bradyrhizobium canariense]